MTDPDLTAGIDDELFEKGVFALAEAVAALRDVENAIDQTDLPMTRADTVALLYGRRNSLNKGDIEEAFEAVERIGNASERDILKNLLAEYGDMNKSEADTFIEEFYDLRRRYGGVSGVNDDPDEDDGTGVDSFRE